MRKGGFMSSINWPADRVERRSIDDLIPYARNARTHSEAQIAQIAASMCEWGWTNPVLIDPDGQILAGHGRVLAARTLGFKECPVMIADGWTQAQKRAYILADNRIAENAGWDEAMLQLELAALQDDDFDLALTGFDADALADLLAGEETTTEGQTDDDTAPEVPEIPVSRNGDLWICGDHQVLCGDATDADSYAVLLGDALADMVWQDPPYNVDYSNSAKDKLRGTNRPILNDNLGEGFYDFLLAALTPALAHCRGAVYIAMSSSELDTLQSAFRAAGGKWSTFIIWAKNTFTLGHADYQRQFEPILYGWPEGGKRHWCGDRDQGDVWQIKKPHKNDLHPTMKPVELVERAIRNSSRPGDVVLDAFGGSGTTLIAAEKSGRRARLIELDPKYVDVIVSRWQEFAGAQAVRQADGLKFDDLVSTLNGVDTEAMDTATS
jgi:DNA modification methylase